MVTVWSPEPEMVFRVKYQLLTSVTQFCKVHREQAGHKISVKATIWSLSGLGDRRREDASRPIFIQRTQLASPEL